jgi:tetratricopeptide (TPR) repeat protein
MNTQDALQLGAEHHRAGRLSEAVSIYRQILVEKGDHPEALYRLGLIAGQLGEADKAIVLINQAIKIGPAQARYYGALGERLEESGRCDEAEAAYESALAIDGKLPGVHNNLGGLLAGKRCHERAIEHYQQALAMWPKVHIVPFNLGRVYMNQGRMDQAIEFFSRAISLCPDFLEGLTHLGDALCMTGRIDEAVVHYRRALAVVEALPEAKAATPAVITSKVQILTCLGDISARSGMYQEAVVRYEKAMKLAPDQFVSLNNYAASLLSLGRFEEAVRIGDLSMRRQPDAPQPHYNLGVALRQLGRFDEAIDRFRRTVGSGLRSLDQEAYWGLMEASLLKARSSPAAPADDRADLPKLPYLGDKLVLLHCDRAARERLRRAGLHGGYAIDPRDGSEIWLSTQLAARPDSRKLSDLIGQWVQWIGNEAAMAGTTGAIWLPEMPQAVADAVRQAAGDDLIEVGGESAEEIHAQLSARAVAPPDTEDKFFAVVSIRNGGVELLPHWLEHYTKLGVDEILLGIFDDVGGDTAAEIEQCGRRWKFRTFTQHWGEASEWETYCQRQTGCRKAGARPGTWILHTDLDELHQYPAPLKEIAAAAARQNNRVIFGRFVDRVAADGSLPAIASHPSLWQQFPMECDLTGRVLCGGTQKVMLARYIVLVRNGHHEATLEPSLPPPIGAPADYRVAHFKWHGGLLDRMRWSLRQDNTTLRWKADTRRFLDWLDRHGGKIDLSDPALRARRDDSSIPAG